MHPDYGPIAGWDVSAVTDMRFVFAGATAFNGDLRGWDVRNVTDMGEMFRGAFDFNGDLGGWEVDGVGDMCSMFEGAAAFNGDLSGWDVRNVTDMTGMFRHAAAFNSDLSKWDTRHFPFFLRVHGAFDGAEAFDGRLPTDLVELMHASGDHRPGRMLWNMARRLLLPVAKMRCIAWFWSELAARPKPNGQAPSGAIAAFVAEF